MLSGTGGVGRQQEQTLESSLEAGGLTVVKLNTIWRISVQKKITDSERIKVEDKNNNGEKKREEEEKRGK
jgi:hypothetical protein